MKKIIFVIYAVIICYTTNCSLAFAREAINTGPYAVTVGEYHLPAVVDATVLPDKMTEVWAKIFWGKTEYFGTVVICPAWFVFTC